MFSPKKETFIWFFLKKHCIFMLFAPLDRSRRELSNGAKIVKWRRTHLEKHSKYWA
jgi:hypothetical protein